MFHWAYGDSYVVTFDCGIEKGAEASKILYTDLSKFVVTAETTGVFDIANYAFDSELDFKTVSNIGTTLTDAQIEEEANYYTKLAVLSWGYLMAEQPEMSMKEIGFDLFENSLPTNDAAVTSSMEDVMMAIAQ